MLLSPSRVGTHFVQSRIHIDIPWRSGKFIEHSNHHISQMSEREEVLLVGLESACLDYRLHYLDEYKKRTAQNSQRDEIISMLDLASYLFAPLEIRATKGRLPKLQLLAAKPLRSWK